MAGPSQTRIAREAGVAQRTVSRVFLDPARVADPVREHVLAIARRLGYRPQQRRSHRVRSVIFLDDPSNGSLLAGAGLRTLSGGLAAAGMTLVHVALPDSTWRDSRRLVEAIRAHHADALCLGFHGSLPTGLDTCLDSLGLPLVWLNRDADRDAVYPDEATAAHNAVKRAIALGHRRIAWLEWLSKTRNRFPHFSIAARRGGCAAACRAAGITLRRIQLPEGTCRTDIAPAARHLRAILDETSPPTLLLGQADEPSLAWTALAGSQGRHIPGDCSLLYLGIGHITVVPLAPTGTVVDWPAIGTAAAAMLVSRLAGAPSQTSIAVPCTWSPGVTLATAPDADG